MKSLREEAQEPPDHGRYEQLIADYRGQKLAIHCVNPRNQLSKRTTNLLDSSSEADAGVGSVVDGIVVLQELLANDSVDTLGIC